MSITTRRAFWGGAAFILVASILMYAELCRYKGQMVLGIEDAIEKCLICGVNVSGEGILLADADRLYLDTPVGKFLVPTDKRLLQCIDRKVSFSGQLTQGIWDEDARIEKFYHLTTFKGNGLDIDRLCIAPITQFVE